MDKLSALSELKTLIEKGLLKYSEYDMIQNVVNKTDNTAQSAATAREVLYRLVDDKSITPEVFETLREEPVASQPVYQQPTMPQQTYAQPAEEKPIKGAGFGFLLAFFLNLVGLILAICLGDEKCKKTALITFVVEIAVGIVIGIIVVILVFTLGPEFINSLPEGSVTVGL